MSTEKQTSRWLIVDDVVPIDSPSHNYLYEVYVYTAQNHSMNVKLWPWCLKSWSTPPFIAPHLVSYNKRRGYLFTRMPYSNR